MARRFADIAALTSVGAAVSKRLINLEIQDLKHHVATSSILKPLSSADNALATAAAAAAAAVKPENFMASSASAVVPPSATTDPVTYADRHQPSAWESTSAPTTSLPSTGSALSWTSTYPPSPSSSSSTTFATHHPSTSSTATTTTPTTASAPGGASSVSYKDSQPPNKDAHASLIRESKWLDSQRATDDTGLNKMSASQIEQPGSKWIRHERIHQHQEVYDSLAESSASPSTIGVSTPAASTTTAAATAAATSPRTVAAAESAQSATPIQQKPSPFPQPSAAQPTTTTTVTSTETSWAAPTPALATAPDATVLEEPPMVDEAPPTQLKKNLTSSKMPTSRVSRLLHYGGLAASMGVGALAETVRRGMGGSKNPEAPVFLNEANMDRLVSKLTRMRGAALKLGQMLSIQDNKMLPPELEQVLLRVQNSANYMPEKQMRKVMRDTLGADWESEFIDFEMQPIAAASIGQVHRAIHRATGLPVAVKVQYPGVAASIDSDLANLKTLVLMSNLLPRGMYLDNTIKVAQRELAWETDYLREAECIVEFGKLLENDPDFTVPRLIGEASGPLVLTMEWMQGETMMQAMALRDQAARDRIGKNILSLCLRELFEFQYMQTDPNWTNFLYNPLTRKTELLDFGATRAFDARFTSLYLKTLLAGAAGDRELCLQYSRELGFLTGHETETMETAHIQSLLILSEPFQQSAPDVYDFSHQTVTQRVKDQIPTMLRYRLTPPPDETYSLHRKLAGAFLLCAKLGARVETKKMFQEITSRYKHVE
ncbi:hypothetical protein DFQ27_002261 [Actinomortierella ambigua]|uniref:ABC1 atypical kinase-like domain-containing protein n=1 Tax=Actinomortierella ambigua TaxID=1343610 RepID=A0A9P6Q9V0_9FUNG|nr:hypothetical protein DFQ27_002261 [Actinomortierella ambigua]